MERPVEDVVMYTAWCEFPWWYPTLPKALEETCSLMDARWLYEFLSNSYLHYRTSAYCGVGYPDVVYRSLLEHAVDQSEDPTSETYVETINAVNVVYDFVKTYGTEILSYYDRLGISDRVCDYVHVVCHEKLRVVQWNFFINPF